MFRGLKNRKYDRDRSQKPEVWPRPVSKTGSMTETGLKNRKYDRDRSQRAEIWPKPVTNRRLCTVLCLGVSVYAVAKDRCCDFLNIFAKKIGEKIGAFDSKQS
jgi:hypothetical protein